MCFSSALFNEVIAASTIGYLIGRALWYAVAWGAKQFQKEGRDKP